MIYSIKGRKNSTGVRFSARLQLVTSCFEGGNSNLFTFFNFIHTSAGQKNIYEGDKICNMLILLNFTRHFLIYISNWGFCFRIHFFVNVLYCCSLIINYELFLMVLIKACARLIFYFFESFLRIKVTDSWKIHNIIYFFKLKEPNIY